MEIDELFRMLMVHGVKRVSDGCVHTSLPELGCFTGKRRNMCNWRRWSQVPYLLGLVAWVLPAGSLYGQFPVTTRQRPIYVAPNGQVFFGSNRFAQGLPGVVNPGQGFGTLDNNLLYGGFNSGAYGAGGYNNPYSSSYGQYPSYYSLQGAAEIIKGQGALTASQQQASIANEKVRGERIANERRSQDQQLYAREKSPTLEDDRERSRIQERDRSRNNPSSTEIWSGKALNDLLVDLQRNQGKDSADAGETALQEDTLNRINVSSTRNGSNVGLLRNEGRLDWPASLSRPDFEKQRDQLAGLAMRAISQAKTSGRVDEDVLGHLDRSADQMRKDLTARVKEFTPSEYMAAKRFLSDFECAIRALHQPDVGNYFNGRYAIKGKTIAEIVKHMTAEGLWFAPATPGDQSAYLALHQALAAYDFAAEARVAK
jgi:hypothetical protein